MMKASLTAVAAIGLSTIQFTTSSSASDIEFGENPYYYDNWCGGSLQYLDDKYCAKKFPSSLDRSWECPVRFGGEHTRGFARDMPLQDVQVDTTTLPTIISNNADLCVIVTRRVDSESYHK
jgi:hypothetical protein